MKQTGRGLLNSPGATNRKPNGIRLVPSANTETYNRDGFLTHSCLNAFGPSLGPRFCSEGCITGSSNDMPGKDHVTLLFCTRQFAFYV